MIWLVHRRFPTVACAASSSILRIMLKLSHLPRLLLVVAALALMARTDRFFTPGTLATILQVGSLVGILAAGQAFVLIGGGFDLSQGAIMGLAAAAAALQLRSGIDPRLTAVITLGLGLALGTTNGVCVAALRMNPFVTTLSTQMIFRGATFVLLGGQQVGRLVGYDWLGAGPEIGGALFPWRAFVFLGVTAVAWLVLRQTVFGQHIYATGGNAEAARLAGVRTSRIRVATFAISGLAASLSAILLLSWVRTAKPDTGSGYELQSIAACVIGGISLQGGAGSVLGAAAGCLLLQTLDNLITRSGFPDEYRTLVVGAVILTFAAADSLSRRDRK
jgi:ribose transport system permease protein